MSWAEIKKAINNDLDTPLNELINNVKTVVDSIKTTLATVNTNTARLTSTRATNIDKLANTTYGLQAIRNRLDDGASNLAGTNWYEAAVMDNAVTIGTWSGKGVAYINISTTNSNYEIDDTSSRLTMTFTVDGTSVSMDSRAFNTNVYGGGPIPIPFDTSFSLSVKSSTSSNRLRVGVFIVYT